MSTTPYDIAAARDNAIRGQIEDDHRADLTDRRRTGDY